MSASTGDRLFDTAVKSFRLYAAASDQIMRVRLVHMGAMTHAADYPVCAHCSELAGRLVEAPCPTMQAAEGYDAACESVLAADRYRHFVLNGFTQQQWDEAEETMKQ